MKFKNILIATDLSVHSLATIDLIVPLFPEPAVITFLTAITSQNSFMDTNMGDPFTVINELNEIMLKNANESQELLCNKFGPRCSKAAISYFEPVAQSICKFAEEGRYDLIVIGSRGASYLTNLFLGSTAQRIIKLATCPIMVVPDKVVESNKSFHGRSLSNILVGTDLSESSIWIFNKLAPELETKDELTIVTVLTKFIYNLWTPKEDKPPATIGDYLQQRVPQAQIRLEELGNQYLQERKVNYKVLESAGNAAETLCSYANCIKSDCIAIGSHGAGILGNLFIGSTVQDILKLSACPVIVFPINAK